MAKTQRGNNRGRAGITLAKAGDIILSHCQDEIVTSSSDLSGLMSGKNSNFNSKLDP